MSPVRQDQVIDEDLDVFTPNGQLRSQPGQGIATVPSVVPGKRSTTKPVV
ncbi:MAG: hypothetical protein GY926_01920 [bacterium]|nr:hypothetical protein [bacterium]